MQWIPTYSVNWDSQAKRMMAGASSKGGLYTQRLLPLKNLKASAVVWYQERQILPLKAAQCMSKH